MPALRKVRRILSTEKGKNFMGSEFTNADMGKPNLSDYTYANIGVVEIEGKKCWKIEAKCKNELVQQENGFMKKISFIDQASFVTYKIEYYDFSGQLHRLQTLSGYKKQSNNRYFAYHMTMQNVQNSRKSEMKVEKFQPVSKLPESAFSSSMLDK
jgi:hypothetical protein